MATIAASSTNATTTMSPMSSQRALPSRTWKLQRLSLWRWAFRRPVTSGVVFPRIWCWSSASTRYGSKTRRGNRIRNWNHEEKSNKQLAGKKSQHIWQQNCVLFFFLINVFQNNVYLVSLLYRFVVLSLPLFTRCKERVAAASDRWRKSCRIVFKSN